MELGFDPIVILRLKLIEKIGIGIGVIIAIAAGYWYFLYQGHQEALDKLNTELKEQELKINTKKRMLTKLPELRKELEDLKEKEIIALRELPTTNEIPALLTNISHAGHAQGLEFQLFAPRKEEERDFYAEVPVDLKFIGSYHDSALFMNQVAQLPRIVNVSDISMIPGGGTASSNLTTVAKATTYRYLEPELETEGEKGKDKKGKRPKK
ncbi:MAG: type 4a pilus biogenesis protein PilO [Magnetococcales bacterium]|nr:type 4a pilus biogenesis protein PilO [Magnetococcales bacterium]